MSLEVDKFVFLVENFQVSDIEIQRDSKCMKPQMETRKKFELQMGFKPTTLRDLDGCSNHWATRDSMVSKDEMWALTGTASRGYTDKFSNQLNVIFPLNYYTFITIMWKKIDIKIKPDD